MTEEGIEIRSIITGEVFTEFAIFDTLIRRKLWRRPAVFAALFALFSAIAFSQAGKRPQAALLGGVLLAVGLGLPAVYFLSFLASVKKEKKRLSAAPSKPAYILRLSGSGVTAIVGDDRRDFDWKTLLRICWLKRCICLYVSENQAFLLTESTGGPSLPQIWEFITKHAGPDCKLMKRKTG